MTQNDRDYSEKREYIRMQVESAATLHVAGADIPALCRDLSGTGMQLEAACNLQIGDKVSVTIASEHAELKSLKAEAQVVRVSNIDNGKQVVGLNVLSMN